MVSCLSFLRSLGGTDEGGRGRTGAGLRGSFGGGGLGGNLLIKGGASMVLRGFTSRGQSPWLGGWRPGSVRPPPGQNPLPYQEIIQAIFEMRPLQLANGDYSGSLLD